MDRARKMVVIPQDTFERLQNTESIAQNSSNETESTVQTPSDKLSRLDAEMADILQSKKFSSEQEKCNNYLQVLRRYLFFRDGERSVYRDSGKDAGESDTSTLPLTEENIIENVPKSYRHKVRLLLNFWRTYEPDRLKWDNTGRVIIDGKTIVGSNIIDLLTDIMKKPRTDDEVPAGRYPFAMFIGRSETPVKLIGNSDILRIAEMTRGPLKTGKRTAMTPVFTPPLTRKAAKKKWMNFE